MARDFLSELQPQFGDVVRAVLEECAGRGIVMRPYSAARSPWEQAVLWRRSRSKQQVDALVATMQAQGADWLADVMTDVGPQHGTHVTNAPPGRSAHQYRLAVDCFWMKADGSAEWNDMTGYTIYATIAQQRGLTAGRFWTSFVDAPHLEDGSIANVGSRTWNAVDAEMYALWGNIPSGSWGRP